MVLEQLYIYMPKKEKGREGEGKGKGREGREKTQLDTYLTPYSKTNSK